MWNIADPGRCFLLSHKFGCAPAKYGAAFRNNLAQLQDDKNAVLGMRVAVARENVSYLEKQVVLNRKVSLLFCGEEQMIHS